MKPIPALARVNELLDYDPATGLFLWKLSRPGRGRKGEEAGTLHVKGHRQIRIDGGLYMAHQIAWLVVHGAWPEQILDHKNRNKADNRIDNLRAATNSQNKANCGAYRTSRSGIKGVASTHSGKYIARLRVNGTIVHLGTFETAVDAAEAFKNAHKSAHGEFSN